VIFIPRYPAEAVNQGGSAWFTKCADLALRFIRVRANPGQGAFQADDAGSIPVGRSDAPSQVKPDI